MEDSGGITERARPTIVMFETLIVPNWLLPVLKPAFDRMLKRIRPHTMVSRKRIQNLWRLLQCVERARLPGDFVELGVARGGTAAMIATVAAHSPVPREVWLYDAFEALDKPFAYYADVERVMFGEFALDRDRVHLIKGFFAEVAPQRPPRPIAFMHIDASGYEPVCDCLNPLYPHVVAGGWVVFDNYGVDDSCRRAVDEFLAAHRIAGQLQRFGTAQVFFQKP